MTVGRLIELALGPEEARKVDTAIPQGVHDQMTQAARENIAGWYYAPEVKLMGRLLTKQECEDQIRHKLASGKLHAFMAGSEDIAFVVAQWPCLFQHAARGEVDILAPERCFP